MIVSVWIRAWLRPFQPFNCTTTIPLWVLCETGVWEGMEQKIQLSSLTQKCSQPVANLAELLQLAFPDHQNLPVERGQRRQVCLIARLVTRDLLDPIGSILLRLTRTARAVVTTMVSPTKA